MNSTIKSNAASDQCRKQGKELYKQAKYVQALELYNKALCYAENIDSKEAGLCFANRSAVFFNLGLPEAAIANIQLARNANYAAEKILNEREIKCQEMMAQPKKANPAKDFFKLSYPAHEKTPFLANCIEIRETKKYGRGMYTTQDLKPGDIISNSGPVLKSIKKVSVYKRCTNCLEVNDMNLFPCPSCVSTMFCSKTCQDEAMIKFHKLECPHIDEYRENLIPGAELCSSLWRSLFATQHVAGGMKKLKAFLDDKELTKKTFLDYDLSKDCKDLALNEFLSALGYLSAKLKYNTFMAPELVFEMFLNSQPLRSTWKTQREKLDVKSILMTTSPIFHMPLCEPFNGQMIEWENETNGRYGDIIGSGITLPKMYFNGNCSPNIMMLNLYSKAFHVVIKPIKKDEQLFEAYR